MKNVVFWDVELCRFWVNRRFGGMYRLSLQNSTNCATFSSSTLRGRRSGEFYSRVLKNARRITRINSISPVTSLFFSTTRWQCCGYLVVQKKSGRLRLAFTSSTDRCESPRKTFCKGRPFSPDSKETSSNSLYSCLRLTFVLWNFSKDSF
jgi:hypothetical protein